jgi:AmmeMemoRadiSam system protein B
LLLWAKHPYFKHGECADNPKEAGSLMTIREAAVAGLFYDADADRLNLHINKLLGAVSGITRPIPKALIVPHAGYVYSGQTAAEAYRCLQPLRDTITRVVLLGPAHRVYLQGMALPAADAFATPLGEVPLDRPCIERIRDLPGVCLSDEAHREEHSLEVQLPFLQTMLARFSLVPLVVGDCDPDRVAAVVDSLWGGPETLLVISTDLSHFHSYKEASLLDLRTCDRLLARDSGLTGEDACGARALNGFMRSRHSRRLAVELLDLCNSGDTAGEKSRVVGYGAFALH